MRAAVRAIASHLPARLLTNEQLAEELGSWTAAQIYEKTGIRSRHIAADDECASDLGAAAAERLFASGSCDRHDVDFLLFCSQTPDYIMPATACLLHRRLGLRPDAGALDFSLGCAGFVNGLALAKGLIETGTARSVLLITADTYSKVMNPRDGSTRTIFGDAAAATLVQGIPSAEEHVGPFVFGTRGVTEDMIVRAGGFRVPASDETVAERRDSSGNWRSEEDLSMNGPEIFNFALRAVPDAVREVLKRAAVQAREIDLFVFHQANAFMLEHLRRKIDIPREKFWVSLESCGNTVSSSIPMALESARSSNQLGPGHVVMLVGFGVGYSWGAGLIRIPE